MSLNFGQNFFPSRGEVLANYDYIDVSEGTGTVIFYGTDHQEGTISGAYLARAKLNSNSITSHGVTNSTTYAELLKKDFDVIFNLSKTIKGKVKASTSIGYTCQSADESGLAYASFALVHVDSSANETIIAQSASEVFTQIGTLAVNTASSVIRNVEIDATAGQHFKKGETLRLSVAIWGKRVSGQPQTYGFAHDPMDRNDDGVAAGGKIIEDTDTTVFTVHVPFRLDI